MIEEFKINFSASFHCNHADFIKVAGMVRVSMFAACALALVSSDYTARGSLWAAG